MSFDDERACRKFRVFFLRTLYFIRNINNWNSLLRIFKKMFKNAKCDFSIVYMEIQN